MAVYSAWATTPATEANDENADTDWIIWFCTSLSNPARARLVASVGSGLTRSVITAVERENVGDAVGVVLGSAEGVAEGTTVVGNDVGDTVGVAVGTLVG